MYNQPYFNPYFNSMDQMRQPQVVQNVSRTIQPQFYCYSVKSAADLAGINIMPNTFYIGLNQDTKEIYMKKMNNDGNIEVETYSLLSEKKEKTDLQAIAERLDNIENKLSQLPIQRQTLTLKGKDYERASKSNNE